jgi:hypothetical protein
MNEPAGTDVFLAFLTATLWPELARHHPVSDETRGCILFAALL